MTESAADRFNRDWQQIGDSRKQRGFDMQPAERKNRRYVGPPVGAGSGLRTINYDEPIEYQPGDIRVTNSSSSLPTEDGEYFVVGINGLSAGHAYVTMDGLTFETFVILSYLFVVTSSTDETYPVGTYVTAFSPWDEAGARSADEDGPALRYYQGFNSENLSFVYPIFESIGLGVESKGMVAVGKVGLSYNFTQTEPLT